MANVTLYTTESCPFCMRAKAFLTQREVPFEEIFISRTDHEGRERLVAETGGYTFPQIIIDGRNIGGWDDLSALDSAGELDALLAYTRARSAAVGTPRTDVACRTASRTARVATSATAFPTTTGLASICPVDTAKAMSPSRAVP